MDIKIVLRKYRAKSFVKKWDTCDFCLACVHHCPFKAIDLKVNKNKDARYRHPAMTLKEIVKSNHQGEKKL